ncbi:cytochrome c3 family protein [Methylocystis sp. JAN1]|uniref:cytochrome c3 family protein n=1 Tax=Methylocystis sp. JAN1 TaxID=3397211 RepID=UPI003FA1DD10
MRRIVLTLLIGACLFAPSPRPQAQTTTPGGYFLPSFGQPLRSSFDHAKTQFPLTGAHAQTSCEACHFNGQYKNTLYACPACHNGNRTIGKPPNHPPTSLKCAGCHETTLFSDIKIIDHLQASAKCAACHDGRIARGKPATHIPTAAPCADCHHTTMSFTVGVTAKAGSISLPRPLPNFVRRSPESPAPGRFDHTSAVGPCATCHNGVNATGKPQRHVPTQAQCDSCHRNTITFAGARFDHMAARAPCLTCHNGRDAQGKPPTHVVTSEPCDNCHKSFLSFDAGQPSFRRRGL